MEARGWTLSSQYRYILTECTREWVVLTRLVYSVKETSPRGLLKGPLWLGQLASDSLPNTTMGSLEERGSTPPPTALRALFLVINQLSILNGVSRGHKAA